MDVMKEANSNERQWSARRTRKHESGFTAGFYGRKYPSHLDQALPFWYWLPLRHPLSTPWIEF